MKKDKVIYAGREAIANWRFQRLHSPPLLKSPIRYGFLSQIARTLYLTGIATITAVGTGVSFRQGCVTRFEGI
jgi:hypothetical protein